MTENTQHDECTICLREVSAQTGSVMLGCSHRFHLRCIVQWFQAQEDSSSCPCCRYAVGALEDLPVEGGNEEDNDISSIIDDDDTISIYSDESEPIQEYEPAGRLRVSLWADGSRSVAVGDGYQG
jgi:hypothetical protein